MRTYKQILEEVQNMNSDKEVKLKSYQKNIDDYNAKKNNFETILVKPVETWEAEAAKIIDGNSYLGDAWSIAKMENTVLKDEDKVKSGEMSQEEIKKINLDITNHKTELNKLKQEIAKKIQTDLVNIQHV